MVIHVGLSFNNSGGEAEGVRYRAITLMTNQLIMVNEMVNKMVNKG